MSTEAKLERAFVNRLRGDDEFVSLVGSESPGGVKLFRGQPTALLSNPTKSRLPIVSWITVSRNPVSNQPATLRIQTDVWEWRPEDSDSPVRGMTRLNLIDERMLELLWDPTHESAVTWYDTDEEIYISSTVIDGSDPPGVLIRRRRDWEIALA